MGSNNVPDLPVLKPGTEVTARFRGAFCLAKVTRVQPHVTVTVAFEDRSLGSATVDAVNVAGPIRTKARVQVRVAKKRHRHIAGDSDSDGELHGNKHKRNKHEKGGEEVELKGAVIKKVTDKSLYTVDFEDGDVVTLRRSGILLNAADDTVASDSGSTSDGPQARKRKKSGSWGSEREAVYVCATEDWVVDDPPRIAMVVPTNEVRPEMGVGYDGPNIVIRYLDTADYDVAPADHLTAFSRDSATYHRLSQKSPSYAKDHAVVAALCFIDTHTLPQHLDWPTGQAPQEAPPTLTAKRLPSTGSVGLSYHSPAPVHSPALHPYAGASDDSFIYPAGSWVNVLSYADGKIYKAQVIGHELRGAGRHGRGNGPLFPHYNIHYKGYSQKFNEWITEDQIQGMRQAKRKRHDESSDSSSSSADEQSDSSSSSSSDSDASDGQRRGAKKRTKQGHTRERSPAPPKKSAKPTEQDAKKSSPYLQPPRSPKLSGPKNPSPRRRQRTQSQSSFEGKTKHANEHPKSPNLGRKREQSPAQASTMSPLLKAPKSSPLVPSFGKGNEAIKEPKKEKEKEPEKSEKTEKHIAAAAIPSKGKPRLLAPPSSRESGPESAESSGVEEDGEDSAPGSKQKCSKAKKRVRRDSGGTTDGSRSGRKRTFSTSSFEGGVVRGAGAGAGGGVGAGTMLAPPFERLASVDEAAMYKYEVGAKVQAIAYYDGRLYKAKVIQRELRAAGRHCTKNSPLVPQYLVHYKGWSRKHDEWVTEGQVIDRAFEDNSSGHSSESPSSSSPEMGKQTVRRTKSGDISGRQRVRGEGGPRRKTEEKAKSKNEDVAVKEKEKERNRELEKTLESLFSDEEGSSAKKDEKGETVKREKAEGKEESGERREVGRGDREEKKKKKENRVKEESEKSVKTERRKEEGERAERRREEMSFPKEQERKYDTGRNEEGSAKKHKRKTEGDREERAKRDSAGEGAPGVVKSTKEEREEKGKYGEERAKTLKHSASPHLGLPSSPKQPLTPRMTFSPATEGRVEGRARTPKLEKEKEDTKSERKRDGEEREREKSPKMQREKDGGRQRSKSPRPASEKEREVERERREKEKERERRGKERERERKEKEREEEAQRLAEKEKEQAKREKERQEKEQRETERREKEKERARKEREEKEKEAARREREEKEKEAARREREEKEKEAARKEREEREKDAARKEKSEKEEKEKQQREREREKERREKERARERSRSPMPDRDKEKHKEKEKENESKKREQRDLLRPESPAPAQEKEKDRLRAEEKQVEKEKRKELRAERERQRSRSRSPMPERDTEQQKEKEREKEREKEKETKREEKEMRGEERERARSRSPMPEREPRKEKEKGKDETREEKEKRRAERKEEKRRRREERALYQDASSPHLSVAGPRALSPPTTPNVETSTDHEKDFETSSESKTPLVNASASLQPPSPGKRHSSCPDSPAMTSPKHEPQFQSQSQAAYLSPRPEAEPRRPPDGKREKSPGSTHHHLEQPAISIDPSFSDIDWESSDHRSAFSPIKPPPDANTPLVSLPSTDTATPTPAPPTEQEAIFYVEPSAAAISDEHKKTQSPPVAVEEPSFEPPSEVLPTTNIEYGNPEGEIPPSEEQLEEDNLEEVFFEIPSDAILLDGPIDGNIYQQPSAMAEPVFEPEIQPQSVGVPGAIGGGIQWTVDESLNGSQPVQWQRTRAEIGDLGPPETFEEEVMEEGYGVSVDYGAGAEMWQQEEGVYEQGENYGYDNQYYRERANSDPFPVVGRQNPESSEYSGTAAVPGPITRFSSAPNPPARFSPMMEVEPLTITATSSDDTPSRRESPDTLGPILSVFVATRATANVGPGPSPLNPHTYSASSPAPTDMPSLIPTQAEPLTEETNATHLAPPLSPAVAAQRTPSPVIFSNPDSSPIVTTTRPDPLPSSPLLGISSSPLLGTHPASGAFSQRSLSEESGGVLGAGVEPRERVNSTGSGTEVHADSKETPTLRGPMKRQGISFPVVVPRRKREKATEPSDAASKD